jgi:hypothetical protein
MTQSITTLDITIYRVRVNQQLVFPPNVNDFPFSACWYHAKCNVGAESGKAESGKAESGKAESGKAESGMLRIYEALVYPDPDI